ncbi:MAG: LysR family transcriptional regulator [Clostridia bacterium]|nr:LysR family transcriptional regulator [Clostridia bacterium]
MEDIDLNLYKFFYTVAKCGSISKAANLLYVSQPAVSYNIKLLEETLNCKLFNRTSKGVEITADAQKLLFYVENAYNTLNTGRKMLNDSTDLLSGEIKIGVPTHIGIFLLAKYIQKFSEQYPGIKFFIVNKSTNEMVDMLEKRNLDMIVDSYPIYSERGDMIISELLEIDNCFVGNEKYKDIADNIKFKVEGLRKIPLLLPPKGTSTRDALETNLKERTNGLESLIDVPTTEVMLALVKRGLGVGYFSRESVLNELKNKQLFEIPVDAELPKTKICIAYVEEFLTNAPKKFCKMVKQEVKRADSIKSKALRIIVTSKCIYNCSICHKEGLKNNLSELIDSKDINYLYSVITNYYGIKEVNLTGGEPLMREDILDIIKGLKSQKAKVELTTNAYYLNEVLDIGHYIDKINISIHTLDKDLYTQMCGVEDAYEKVIFNIKALRTKFPTLNMNINMTLIKNINDDPKAIESMIKFANSLKVSLKIVELYPKTSKSFVNINKIIPLLEKSNFKVRKTKFRKTTYTNSKQDVALARCTCSIVSEHKDKTKTCSLNNDLYITPDGKLSLCREREIFIDILNELKTQDAEGLIKKIELALNTMGENCKC